MQADLAIEPIVALRTWHVSNGSLCGWTQIDWRWPKRRAAEATCSYLIHPVFKIKRCDLATPGPPHQPGCCGLYAIAVPRIRNIHVEAGLLEVEGDYPPLYLAHHPVRPSFITGFVALWGRVLLGQNGVYRAQYAYPLAIFSSQGIQPVADSYGVPVLPAPKTLPELARAAQQARELLRAVR